MVDDEARGGRTFARRTTPAKRPLAVLWVSPGGVLYGVGDDGEVVLSSDGGRTFQAVSSGVDEDLTDVTGCDEELWIVGESGTVLRH